MYSEGDIDLSQDGSALVVLGGQATFHMTALELWINGALLQDIEVRHAPATARFRINRLTSDQAGAPLHCWMMEDSEGERCPVNFAPQWRLQDTDTAYLYAKKGAAAATFECPIEGRRMRAVAGQTYYFSGSFGAHRCSGTVELSFFDAQGRALQRFESQIPAGREGGPKLADYAQAVVSGQAPPDAATLSVRLVKGPTTIGNDSFLFFTLPALVRDHDNAAEAALSFSPDLTAKIFAKPDDDAAIFFPDWPASLPRDRPVDLTLVEPSSGARLQRSSFRFPVEDKLEVEVFGLDGAVIVAQARNVPAKRRSFTLTISIDGEIASLNPLFGLKTSDTIRLILPASVCDGRLHLFQVREELNGALLGQFTDLAPDRAALRAIPRGHSQSLAGRAFEHSKAQRVDDKAKIVLGRLSPKRLAALFDLEWMARSSGTRFTSAGQALLAYFKTPPPDRVSPCPYFDRDAYAPQSADFLDENTDPFCHFINNVQTGGRPTRIIDPQRLAKGAQVSGDRLELYCDFLAGMEVTSFHALVDIPYIQSQDGFESLTSLDVLAMVSDEDSVLPFSPHPLFDPAFYRRQINPACGNELLDYLKHRRNAVKTHALLSPEFLSAQNLPLDGHMSLLESYVTSWPEREFAPSLFVSPTELNDKMVREGVPVTEEPLSEMIRRDLGDKDWLHAEIDSRILASSFANLETSTDTIPLLEAALQMPTAAAYDRPWLSVIIVTYFKPVYTAISILAALNALRSTPHEIIVIENGGELFQHEELLRIFAAHPSVKFMKLPRNRYFGEGNNIGLDQASGAYVLFLNNDCFLTPDFGEMLQETIKDSGAVVDAIGAALLYPDGDIQEFGGAILEDGNPIQKMKHLSGTYLDDLAGLRKVDYASAACLCVSRRALDRVTGFDPLYEPFYFEDTDFCRRLTQAGFDLYVSSRLRAVHIENASTRDFLGDGFNALVQRNRERFARRWVKNRGADTYLRRPLRSSDKTRRALIYTPFDIRIGGGEAYLLNAAAALSQTHRIVFALPERISHARLEFACHALGIEPFAFDVATLPEAMSHNTDYDVAFVMGNEIVPPIAPLGRINFYHLQFPFPWRNVGVFDFTRVGGYDAVIVNSGFTADWTTQRFNQAGLRGQAPPVHILAPPVRALPFTPRGPLEKRPLRLANVGRFFVGGHSKRQDVFVEIIAQLRAAKVDVTGVLIGSATEDADAKAYFAKVAERAKAVGVELLGECSRADIARTLQQADIYLHCCGYQVDASLAPEQVEHFGIAVVEAMTAGAYPIVVNAGGPAEIVQATGVGAVFDTVKQAKMLIQDFIANPRSTAPAMPWAAGLSEARFAERLLGLVERYDGAVQQKKRSA